MLSDLSPRAPATLGTLRARVLRVTRALDTQGAPVERSWRELPKVQRLGYREYRELSACDGCLEVHPSAPASPCGTGSALTANKPNENAEIPYHNYQILGLWMEADREIKKKEQR